MKIFYKHDRKVFYLSALLIFLIVCAYYLTILYLRIPTDIPVHAQIAYSFVNDNDKLTPNFLYYFLLALFAGYSKQKVAYYIASVVLLSMAVAFKFLVNSFYIKKYTPQTGSRYMIILSVVMLFVFCLPGPEFSYPDRFYLGQLTPNVWHNSTVIFLFPFAIITFFKVYELLYSHETSKKIFYQVTILILINALIKPSLLFTIIPAFFLLFFFTKWQSLAKTRELKKLLPFIIGIALIAAEYFIIYRLNYTSQVTHYQQSNVKIAPFEVWAYFSNNILLAFLSSCILPLIYIFFTKTKALKDPMVLFSVTNFMIALLIWILFAESGERKFHGNFYWQVVISYYLLFFSLLLHLANTIRNGFINKVTRFTMVALFSLHFIWGVFYWLKIIIFKGYS